ncbi:hypothetical protein M9Y10_036741 [Tritrichomonas musculus]|uniref:DnaK protein n=1 Tax=Tritrichomonas musculus TaxID=1915356 RepID=A0ABR2GTQ9_9EUKA
MNKKITAGIDFGNQSCILAIPSEHGVDIVLNESSNRRTPTIVGYQEGRRSAGEFAQQQHMMNIHNTITQLKRLVGLPYDSQERESISNSVPYKIVPLEDGLSGIELDNGTILRIEQILGYYIKSLLEIIQKKNPKIQQIVLTVPPSWTEIQRRSILNAATISDIKIASLLDSSLASAVAYVKIHGDRFPEDKEKGLNVLFIEFGDTSMNASIGKLSKSSIEIKSTISDSSLGGQQFTDILEKYLIEKVCEKYKIDPRTNKRSLLRFKQAVEKTKKTLSSNPIVLFEVPSLMNDIDVSMTVKREEFNDLIKEHISKIRPQIEEVIKKAEISKEDISFVEIVGGCSRIALIKNEIKEIIGSEAKMSLDLDECFAIGAGYMASKIDGNDIGIEIINSKCPFEITTEAGQESEVVNVFTESSQMPSTAKVTIPITQKQSLSFMCNNQQIGIASIETGIENKVDVDLEVSIDSFGLIDIKDAAYKLKPVEENIENKDDNEEENAEIKEETKEEEENAENKEETKEEEENAENKEETKEEEENAEINEDTKEEEEEKVENNEENSKAEDKEENKEIVEINDAEKAEKEILEEEPKQENFQVFKCSSFSYLPVMTLSSDDISAFQKVEKEQSLQDELQLEIDNTKNDLESLIFSTENEIKAIKEEEEETKEEVENMKKNLESIHNWFEENEFERLTLEEYKSKINEINQIRKGIENHKKYEEKKKQLLVIKEKLNSSLDEVKKDTERLQLEESISLQKEIPKEIEKVDEVMKLSKEDVISIDLSDLEKEVKEVENKVKALKQIKIVKKRRVKRRVNNNRMNQQRGLADTWSPFGRNSFFDDFMSNPWSPRRQVQSLEDEYEYSYEYDEIDDEKDKRTNNKNAHRKQSSAQKNAYDQEQLRRQEQEEQLRRQYEMENRRRAQLEQEEQLRRQYELENRRRAQLEQEEQFRRQYELENRRRAQLEQEEQLRRQYEMENRRRAQLEQEKLRRAKEAEMRRQRSMNDPWGSPSCGYPFGYRSNPQRQNTRPRQQQRRVIPGYGYTWGF